MTIYDQVNHISYLFLSIGVIHSCFYFLMCLIRDTFLTMPLIIIVRMGLISTVKQAWYLVFNFKPYKVSFFFGKFLFLHTFRLCSRYVNDVAFKGFLRIGFIMD